MSGQIVLVDGQRVSIPGVYPEVTVADLSKIVGPGERVPLVIGASDGGLPGKVYAFSSYPEAAAVLRGGGSLSYISRIFSPSPDLAGARRVLFIRANSASAPGSVDLVGADDPGLTLRIDGNFESVFSHALVLDADLIISGSVFAFDAVIVRRLGPGQIDFGAHFANSATSGLSTYIDSPIAEANIDNGFFVNDILIPPQVEGSPESFPVVIPAASDTVRFAFYVSDYSLFLDYWEAVFRHGVDVTAVYHDLLLPAASAESINVLLDIPPIWGQTYRTNTASIQVPFAPEDVSFTWSITGRQALIGDTPGDPLTQEWIAISGSPNGASVILDYGFFLGDLSMDTPLATIGVDIVYPGGTAHLERPIFIQYA